MWNNVRPSHRRTDRSSDSSSEMGVNVVGSFKASWCKGMDLMSAALPDTSSLGPSGTLRRSWYRMS